MFFDSLTVVFESAHKRATEGTGENRGHSGPSLLRQHISVHKT